MHLLRRALGPTLAGVLVLSATTAVLSVSAASGSSSTVTCRAKNIGVSVEATSRGLGGEQVIPVFFINHGGTCQLPLGGPVVDALRDTVGGRITKTTQLSAPSFPDGEKRYLLDKGSRAEDNFVIVQYSKSMMASPRCDAKTATGFDIQNFSKPQGASRYFARTLSDVCFYRGTGDLISNIGMQWVGTSS